ncbi:DNA/RNA non-specific endonuclease [Vagococcus salmoninarum]|uniref:DNA/RNA non-specific endonuclease n=1 Tax=Vagococcus salmoninarum TaxID=2739 RepID=UPI00188189E5|nr:DNA/RNA non-specific endonuclease [Vagococcus salmoninarum]MBE9387800.1 DNA/RNA non-specific endonuclease [Vagococcus salmoninarum]
MDKKVKEKLLNWEKRPKNTDVCHIIAKCLGGSNGVQNIFIGTENLNRKLMWPIEKIVLEEMSLPIFYKVNLIYDEGDTFCDSVEITIVPAEEITTNVKKQVRGVKVKFKNITQKK